MKEIWKSVVGFEGLYEVSDQGRVRSLDHNVLAVASSYGGRKVDADDVRLLRRKRAAGATYQELSKEFGICISHVGNVVHRRRYAHV
jgi:hypothetical protein